MPTIVPALFRYPLGDDAALILRTPDIAEAYNELTVANIDRLARWEPWAATTPSLERTRGFLEAGAKGWVDGAQLPVAIAVPADGGWRLVGSAGLRIDRFLRSGEIGYWIDAAYEGRGLVTRAVTTLVDAGFRQYGLGRLTIGAIVDNVRSRAVAERLGFTEEGILRGAIPFGADRRDEVVYGLLAEDWKGE